MNRSHLAALLFLAPFASGCSSAPSSAPSTAGTTTDSDAQELDLEEGTFTVPAGGEVVYCERIPMPAAFQGRDLAITDWESDIPAPAHHDFMFYDTTPTSVHDARSVRGRQPDRPGERRGARALPHGRARPRGGNGARHLQR